MVQEQAVCLRCSEGAQFSGAVEHFGFHESIAQRVHPFLQGERGERGLPCHRCGCIRDFFREIDSLDDSIPQL
jgi:hypothetical protein